MLADEVKEMDETVKDVVKRLVYSEKEVKRLQEEPNLSVVKDFKCDPCKKTFNSKKAFKEHRKENNEQKIKCKYCDESFMENWKLEIHM